MPKYPRWLIIWFVISVIGTPVATLVAPIAHRFASDFWKPIIWLIPALAWLSLALILHLGDKYTAD